LNAGSYISGDFIEDDILLAISNPNTVITIDIAPTRQGDPAVATVRSVTGNVFNAADIAFNSDRTAGYGMGGQSLFILNLPGAGSADQLGATGRASAFERKTVQGVPLRGTYGAAFVDQEGNAYFWNNDQRQMYLITPDELKKAEPTARVLGSGSATVLGSGQALNLPTDGASCPTAPVVTVSLAYRLNQGKGNVPDIQTGFADQTVTVESSSGFERDGFEFAGWNTARDGSGDSYSPGAPFALGSADAVLYAQWNAVQPAPVIPAANVVDIPVLPVSEASGQFQFNVVETLELEGRFSQGQCLVSNTSLVNGDFELPVIPAKSFRLPNQRDVPGWETTATDGRIEIWSTGFQRVDAPEGKQFAELNATQASELFQVVDTTPGDVLTWSLMHRARGGGSAGDTMTVNIGEEDNAPNATYTFTTTLSQGWVRRTGTYVVPEGQTRTRFGFESGPTASGRATVGNFLDDIFFTSIGCIPKDQPAAEEVAPVTDPSGPQQPVVVPDPPVSEPGDAADSDDPLTEEAQTLDTSSIRLVNTQTNTLSYSVQNAAGTWEVNTRTGAVSLAPNPLFSGTATMPVVISTTTGVPYTIELSAPVQRCDTGPSRSTTVYFGVLSDTLSPQSQRKLRTLVRNATKQGSISCAVVRGFVQPVGGTANDKSLSKARAAAVASYLKELGVTRVADVEGRGRAKQTGPDGRRATAKIYVQVGS
jgi:outer membrane protein OmpA-like peptidoglycan-associated protein